MAEVSEENTSKIIHAAKKGLTAEVLRLLRKDEIVCAAARDKVNQLFIRTFITFCISSTYSILLYTVHRNVCSCLFCSIVGVAVYPPPFS